MTPAVVDQLWSEALYTYLENVDDIVSFLTLSSDEENQLQELRTSLQYIDDTKVNLVSYIDHLVNRLPSNSKITDLRIASRSIFD